MGTNYYWSNAGECPHCGNPTDIDKHIGKSSMGWCFSLHVYPTEGINDLRDWQERWSEDHIHDEYGRKIDIDEMMRIITARVGKRITKETKNIVPYPYMSWDDFHRANGSQEGPNGLLRHKIGKYCIGHGAGTYDYITGDFS